MTQPWGRKITNPRAIGEVLEGDVKCNMINTLSELDQWMAETAEKMPRSPPGKKIQRRPNDTRAN